VVKVVESAKKRGNDTQQSAKLKKRVERWRRDDWCGRWENASGG
jgi:hypothetical protein